MARDSFNVRFDNASKKRVGAYFATWGIYGRNFHPADVPVENLTHVYLAFGGICGDNPGAWEGGAALKASCAKSKYDDTTLSKAVRQPFELELDDHFAWLGKSYDGDRWDQPVKGILGQVRHWKTRNPNVKVILSIGGWSYTRPFLLMSGNPQARTTFVNSVRNFLSAEGLRDLFDGIDIDFEFPGGGGLDGDLDSHPVRQRDGADFVALLADLRAMLDKLPTTQKRYELTTAIGTGPEKLAKVDFKKVAQIVDQINLMSYDFHGSWSEVGHNTNARLPQGDQSGLAVRDIVSTLVDRQGVAPAKLSVGAAFYGRAFQTKWSNSPLSAVGQNGTVPAGVKTVEDGILSYFDLWKKYVGPNGTGINGFVATYDDRYGASIVSNAAQGIWLSYESPRSIADKGKILADYKLGGMFAWEIDDDNGLLLNAMHRAVGNQPKK